LVRWNHPERGLVMPDQFVPLAEETGLIAEIGRGVLHEACTQGAAWQRGFSSEDRTRFRLAVNLSGRQVDTPTLTADVEIALAESQFDPRALVLEMTESVMMDS